MNTTKKALFLMLFFTGLIVLFILAMQPLSILQFGNQIVMLFPKGNIALEQRNLLFMIQGLMLLIIIPVYILTFFFAWKYRAGHSTATYDPDLTDHTLAECIWWGIPSLMILVISIIAWVKTYELDPYQPLVSDKKPITIQVVALQWKWLFIYPEEKIATVNFIQFPAQTPIHFEITADSPMNAFWIPSLGGHIYAMPNMKTELNLIANEDGDFRGSSANISGEGFAGMHFIARASSQDEYDQWVQSAKTTSKIFDFQTYKRLALPSQNEEVSIYRLNDNHLFNAIFMQYMHPKK